MGVHYDVYGVTLFARGCTLLPITLKMSYIMNIVKVKFSTTSQTFEIMC